MSDNERPTPPFDGQQQDQTPGRTAPMQPQPDPVATGQTQPGASEAPLRLRIVLGASEPSSEQGKTPAHRGLHLRGIPIVFVGAAAPRDSVRAIYHRVLSSIPALYGERAAHARAALDSTMWTESPDPRLDLAVRWAALNLDEALACNPDLGCGLIASGLHRYWKPPR